MAKHFRDSSDAAGQQRPADSTRVAARTSRGGDESYHAPAGNRYASASAQGQAVGYKSVVTDESDSRRGNKQNRRRKYDYVDTDPYDIKGRRDPKRRRMRVVSTILVVVGLLLLLGAAGMWAYNQYRYHEQDVINEKLAVYATVDETGASAPQVDWASLKAINPDVVGWIQIPGTVVNYPVYQGDDNDEYLHTSAEGEYALGGQIFLDSENTAPGMVDAQTIIYGHHLRNGSMFKTVADMENQSMFDSVQTIWYVTETATYELQPLLAYKTDGDDENVRVFSFDTTDALHEYLQGLLAKSSSSSAQAADLIAGSSQALSLCTCSYTENETGRVVLVCVPKQAQAAPEAAEAQAVEPEAAAAEVTE